MSWTIFSNLILNCIIFLISLTNYHSNNVVVVINDLNQLDCFSGKSHRKHYNYVTVRVYSVFKKGSSWTWSYDSRLNVYISCLRSLVHFSVWGLIKNVTWLWFTTTYAISTYQHWSCEFESRSWRGVFDTTLCDKVC